MIKKAIAVGWNGLARLLQKKINEMSQTCNVSAGVVDKHFG
jgi:hypothetical protein